MNQGIHDLNARNRLEVFLRERWYNFAWVALVPLLARFGWLIGEGLAIWCVRHLFK